MIPRDKRGYYQEQSVYSGITRIIGGCSLISQASIMEPPYLGSDFARIVTSRSLEPQTLTRKVGLVVFVFRLNEELPFIKSAAGFPNSGLSIPRPMLLIFIHV